MKCHWCEKITKNTPTGEHEDIEGNPVVLCDVCQKASDEGLIWFVSYDKQITKETLK